MHLNPSKLPALLLLGIGSVLFFAAQAVQAAVPDASATVEKDERVYLVNADGTWAMNRDLSIRINNAQGVTTLANQAFDYNATLEKLDIVEAYTEKPDGRRLPVPPARIREQQAQGSRDKTMFEDECVFR